MIDYKFYKELKLKDNKPERLKPLFLAASLKRLSEGLDALLQCFGHLFNVFPFVFMLSN